VFRKANIAAAMASIFILGFAGNVVAGAGECENASPDAGYCDENYASELMICGYLSETPQELTDCNLQAKTNYVNCTSGGC